MKNEIKTALKKVLATSLTALTIFALAIPCFAADPVTTGGTTPVNLSSVNSSGDPAATLLSATVPTAFNITMKQDGAIQTATNLKITNNSYGPVRVKSATITAGTGWNLVAFGAKSTIAGEKVDSNKIGFAMKLGSGTQVKTTTTSSTQTLISAPTTGCYMSGKDDSTNNNIAITYDAIVTAVSAAKTNANVANVVFVIEFDTAA